MKTLALLLTALLCGAALSSAQEHRSSPSEEDNEVEDGGNMRMVYKLVVDCLQKEDISVCLKMKAVNFLDRALALRAPLPIMDFLTLARDPQAPEPEAPVRPLTESELEATLPRSMDEKSSRLDQMMMEKVDQLLRTRSLQLALPQDFEGRKKKGGYGMLLAGGAAMAGMMMQLALGKIALIAGKALMVAKIALVLSAVIGLKKLLGGGGGGESHPQVVYASEHGGGWGHGRSLDSGAAAAAHDMAYNAHVPAGASS